MHAVMNIVLLKKIPKPTMVKLLKTAGSFVLSKGTAFLAPLLFLRFVTLEEYGVVEYSYAAGSLLAIVAALGLYGAYPYFVLKLNERDKIQVFLFYSLPVTLVVALMACIYRWGIVAQPAYFVILFTLTFALQRLYSTMLKSDDKGFIAVLLDSGYYFVLSGVIVALTLCHVARPLDLLLLVMELYLTALCLFLNVLFFKCRTFSYKEIVIVHIPRILAFSYKMIISGFLVYWLTSSSRIYIKWLLDYEDVGIYSFYFRVAGIAVVLYNFVFVAFFRSLYKMKTQKMDLYYSVIMAIVACGCIVCMFMIPYMGPMLGKHVSLDNKVLYSLLSLQMPIWVGFSLCEAIIGRENLVWRFNVRISALLLLFPILLWTFRSQITLMNFIFFNSLVFTAAFISQLHLLGGAGIKLKKCFVLSIILCLSSILVFSFNVIA